MPRPAVARPATTLLAIGALLALLAVERHIAASAAATHRVVATAVALDLTATAALVTWWLGVRRAAWPRWTPLVIAAGGLVIARAWVPSGLIAAMIVVEATALTALVVRARIAWRAGRAVAATAPGPVAVVEHAVIAAGAPRALAGFLATDLVVLAYATTGWFRRAPRDGFAMHRRKHRAAVVALLVGLIAVETAALHVALAGWSAPLAWVSTASAAYLALWMIADLHVLRLAPLRVTPTAVLGPVGVRWRLDVPRDAIAAATPIDAVPPGALAAVVGEPTVLLTLTRPVEVRGLLGRRRTATAIALTVDAPEAFIAALGPGR
ncbi:MAG: hypothetical protein JNK64_31410 [Myxococcales bacterium]|nr:hypothetical protein [Myxococcales bacterium]